MKDPFWTAPAPLLDEQLLEHGLTEQDLADALTLEEKTV